MLEGEVAPGTDGTQLARQYYTSIEHFAEASVRLCEENKFRKLERFLVVACKLFKEGNQTVRNGIVNVYFYTLSRSPDSRPSHTSRSSPLCR